MDNNQLALSEARARLAAGAWDEALRLFQGVLNAKPRDLPTAVGAALGRGEACLGLRDFPAAAAAFTDAGVLAPDDPQVAVAVARGTWRAGNAEAAKSIAEHALSSHGDDEALLRLLADLYDSTGDIKAALKMCKRLAARGPGDALVRAKAGRLWIAAMKNDLAAAEFNAALALDPACAPALEGLADLKREDGDVGQARALLLRRADIAGAPDIRAAARFKSVLLQPVIARDVHETAEARAALSRALEAGPEAPFADPWVLGLGPSFYLGYQGRDDRSVQEGLARYYLAATPSLARRAPHVGRKPGKRLRVGIISNYFFGHTVGYLTHGLVAGLDRTRFDLVLVRTPRAIVDEDTAKFAAAAPMVDVPPALPAAAEMIASLNLDILHYPEVGMDHFAYFLAFSRLATLQTMAWGHPITSGIPNMDLFLSVDAMEPETAAAHYRERLVRLQGLSFAVARVDADTSAAAMLDPKRPSYVCAQSLFKLHPDFDPLLAAILENDPDGVVYLLGHGAYADEIVKARLAKKCGGNVNRIKIIPKMPAVQFRAMVRSADVVLDVPQWSGGKTSLDALAEGTPIVHLPGEFMRGRHSLAFYRRMGLESLVAGSAGAYVTQAVRFVHDRAFRNEVRAAIADSSAKLFGDIASIREIEDVWARAVQERVSSGAGGRAD